MAYADSCFLMMFLVSAKPTEFPVVVMGEIPLTDGSREKRPSKTHKPRAWRWLNVKQSAIMSLAKVITKKRKKKERKASASGFRTFLEGL